MKHVLIYIATIFCLMNNAYGMESDTRVSIFQESMENGSATSIGMKSGGVLYGGVSLNYIESSTAIQYNNRKTIYPIYVFIGLRAPWKLSPFIEVGGDLPDVIIDDLTNKEEDAENEIDYYFSGGLEVSVTDKLSLSLYAKKYNFIFRENPTTPISTARPTSYGAGIILHY